MSSLSAKHSGSLVWWEDALWKTFWEAIWRTYYSFWFTCWVSPYNCEGSVKNPSTWKESLTWIVPRIRSVRGGNLEGWRTDRRPWGVGNDGRIGNLLRKTQCKGSNISNQNWKFIFPVAAGWIKLPGGDQELRTSTSIRDRPIQRESHVDFLGESEGSLPPPQDSLSDAGEARNDFWSMSGNFIYLHHVEPRVKFYSPREESFLIPLKYIDVSRIAQTNLDVMRESRHRWLLEYRWITDSRTGFTQFTLLVEKTSRRIFVVRGDIDKTASDIQARSLMARTLQRNGKECEAEGEAKVVWGKAPPWKRTKIAKDLFHRPWGYGIQRNHQERA